MTLTRARRDVARYTPRRRVENPNTHTYAPSRNRGYALVEHTLTLAEYRQLQTAAAVQ